MTEPSMRLTLKPTEHFFMAGDVMCRMWEGLAHHSNNSSEPCIALISMVGLTDDIAGIAAGLVSIPPPTAEEAREWAATVLSKRYDEA